MSERICMFCKHLQFEDGGYGEYADPAGLYCGKGHFEPYGAFVHDIEDFRAIIVRAQNCKDYDEASK